MSVSTVHKFVPSIQNRLTLDGESTKIHFCKPPSVSANLKLPCKPGIQSPEVLTIIPTAMFFTKNEIMLGRLVKAVSERTIRCCYSSHSSTDEIIDFLSSLQFESITPFVCPDKDTPLDSVNVFILNTLKHQNPNTSNDSSTKLWKEKIKFNKRGKRKLYLEKISTHLHLRIPHTNFADPLTFADSTYIIGNPLSVAESKTTSYICFLRNPQQNKCADKIYVTGICIRNPLNFCLWNPLIF